MMNLLIDIFSQSVFAQYVLLFRGEIMLWRVCCR